MRESRSARAATRPLRPPPAPPARKRPARLRRVRGRTPLCLALLVLALTASPAAAKTIRWGSSLKPAATRTVQGVFHADAEFWPTSLGTGTARGVQRAVKAPSSGRILQVKLKT